MRFIRSKLLFFICHVLLPTQPLRPRHEQRGFESPPLLQSKLWNWKCEHLTWQGVRASKDHEKQFGRNCSGKAQDMGSTTCTNLAERERRAVDLFHSEKVQRIDNPYCVDNAIDRPHLMEVHLPAVRAAIKVNARRRKNLSKATKCATRSQVELISCPCDLIERKQTMALPGRESIRESLPPPRQAR